jgi:UDP-glucose 4-epimerase
MNFWLEKRVLVTGGAGFIGSGLVRKLVQAGAHVSVVDDLSKGTVKNLDGLLDKLEFSSGNLLESGVAVRMLKGIEICFHCAAKIGGIGYFHKAPAESLRDNLIMNVNLWDAARGGDVKMVCVSSSMVFERTTFFPTPEEAITNSPPPLSGYGFSKLVAEYIARIYHEQYGMRYLIVRPFNAYGPGEMPGEYGGYAHVIPDLVKKILSGQYPLEIMGSGKQTRSYTYVDDVADAMVYLAERCENDDFNIGTGVETSVLELAQMLWSLCKRKEPFAFEATKGFEQDVKRRVPDISKIRELGWNPKVNLDRGLAITVDWLVQEEAA